MITSSKHAATVHDVVATRDIGNGLAPGGRAWDVGPQVMVVGGADALRVL